MKQVARHTEPYLYPAYLQQLTKDYRTENMFTGSLFLIDMRICSPEAPGKRGLVRLLAGKEMENGNDNRHLAPE
jgi:hypothetical protein